MLAIVVTHLAMASWLSYSNLVAALLSPGMATPAIAAMIGLLFFALRLISIVIVPPLMLVLILMYFWPIDLDEKQETNNIQK